MRRFFLVVSSFFIFGSILLGSAVSVFAQGSTFPGTGGGGSTFPGTGIGREQQGKSVGIPNPLCPPGEPDCERASIMGLLSIILSAMLWIATPLAVLFVIIAAYHILMAGGNSTKVQEAIDQIKWIAIGYAIILISKSIVSIVINFVNDPVLK